MCHIVTLYVHCLSRCYLFLLTEEYPKDVAARFEFQLQFWRTWLLYMIICCDLLIIDDLCNEIRKVEDKSEAHEKSTPLPTISGLHTYSFRRSILLCGLWIFLSLN